MAHPIRIRPQVEAEIHEAMVWYGDRVPGLDREFYRTVGEMLARISETPGAFPTIRGEIRRAILRKLPYALF